VDCFEGILTLIFLKNIKNTYTPAEQIHLFALLFLLPFQKAALVWSASPALPSAFFHRLKEKLQEFAHTLHQTLYHTVYP